LYVLSKLTWKLGGIRRKLLSMKTIGRCLLFVVLCTSAVAERPRQSDARLAGWVLRFDGIGAVRVGMTLGQVNAALGEKFSVPTEEDEKTCFYVEPQRHPDTGIMMLEGRVARVEVFAPEEGLHGTMTAAGIRIGDSEARVKYGLRFETDESDERKVTSYYAGTFRAIEFVEGCL